MFYQEEREMDSRIFKRIVMLFLLLVMSLSSGLFADLNDGLVGYWSFDDGTAADNSGNGNNQDGDDALRDKKQQIP